ncbi:MAG: hypothetical protein M0Z94_10270 [Dehalococcoidales bacterium]|nr:hypothetical protein [Dehalococcoidales bacterium]
MKHRWLVYLAVGTLFGVVDFVYLGFLYPAPSGQSLAYSPAGTVGSLLRFLVLNVGVWLVPVVPLALYESRVSRSRLHPAAVGLAVWCAAIVAYYLTNAAQLAFWGLPTRPELHISNAGSEYFWENWANVLQGDILGGIMEWLIVAVVGGAMVGLLTGSIYLRFNKAPDM